MQEEYELLLRFFKVFNDSNRLKLLGLLANKEYGVDELATMLKLKSSVVLRHLAALQELGVVSVRCESNRRIYSFHSATLQRLSKEFLAKRREASIVDNAEGDAWERRVLRDFFEGDRLKDLPASSKKRAVIVKWFASLFEPGVLYKESEVNEMIKRHHPDAAYFRRELVNVGRMRREKGMYWRP